MVKVGGERGFIRARNLSVRNSSQTCDEGIQRDTGLPTQHQRLQEGTA